MERGRIPLSERPVIDEKPKTEATDIFVSIPDPPLTVHREVVAFHIYEVFFPHSGGYLHMSDAEVTTRKRLLELNELQTSMNTVDYLEDFSSQKETLYYRMFGGKSAKPEELWKRLGLEKEYRAEFTEDRNFLNSPQSWVDIYLRLYEASGSQDYLFETLITLPKPNLIANLNNEHGIIGPMVVLTDEQLTRIPPALVIWNTKTGEKILAHELSSPWVGVRSGPDSGDGLSEWAVRPKGYQFDPMNAAPAPSPSEK